MKVKKWAKQNTDFLVKDVDDLTEAISKNGEKIFTQDRKPRYIIACATLSLIVTIMIFALGLALVVMIDNIEEQTEQRVVQLREQQFNEVWGLVTAAQHSAYLHSSVVRDRIARAIERTYHTPELMDQLKAELSNPTDDSQITQIFMNAIENMYLYDNTDFNGMSVIVTYDLLGLSEGVRGHLVATHNNNFTAISGNQVGRTGVRFLQDLVAESYNVPIAKQHANHILGGPSGTNTIPFIQVSYPGTSVSLSSMDMYAVYEAFLQDGMAAFYGLVVSGSSYLFDREDVFGVSSFSVAGYPSNNHIIVITQHFRVEDMLNRHHAAQIARYSLLVENAMADAVAAIAYRQVVFIVLISFWLVFMVVITTVQNSMANKIELNYLRNLHQDKQVSRR